MKMKRGLMLLIQLLLYCLVSGQGIKIEPGSCLKIETATHLNISNAGSLLIKSDASGDASLIDHGTLSYSGGGNTQVERYLTNEKWHLLSSPIQDLVAGQFAGHYLQIHNESTNNWSDITSVTYNLPAVKGFAIWTTDSQPTTELYTGVSNTGNQSFNFTKIGEGYNLVGNPFPSVLNWNAVSIPAELNAAVWLFDPTIGTNGDYRYYIPGGGNLNTTTANIPSGQGFFVKAVANGTLILNNNHRIHGGQAFYKEAVSAQSLLIKATGNEITTQTAIRFIGESTSMIDRLYDVNKIISGSIDVPNLYTDCVGEKMAINSLPSIEGHENVLMLFESGLSGTYVLSAAEIVNFSDDIPIYLEDIALNYVQNMRENPEYSIDYTAGITRPFIIHFAGLNNLEDYAVKALDFNCNISNGYLFIKYLGQSEYIGKALIHIYNSIGQLVQVEEINRPQTAIPLSVSAALYIVKIQYEKDVYTSKIVNQ